MIDPELIKKILGDEKPITNRFADTLRPTFDITKFKLNNIFMSDEDVLSYILFPQIAEKFFKARDEQNTVKVSYSVYFLKTLNKVDSKELNNSNFIDMDGKHMEIANRELNLIGVDESTAALVIAIMCDHLKTSTEELHFKFIKALDIINEEEQFNEILCYYK